MLCPYDVWCPVRRPGTAFSLRPDSSGLRRSGLPCPYGSQVAPGAVGPMVAISPAKYPAP
jgi:hypothetical protein